MATYLITYDLVQPGRNYSALSDAIKALANGWWHHLDSVWLVNTNMTAAQVRDRLKPVLDANDKLLVVSLGYQWATVGLPAEANSWLQQNYRSLAA